MIEAQATMAPSEALPGTSHSPAAAGLAIVRRLAAAQAEFSAFDTIRLASEANTAFGIRLEFAITRDPLTPDDLAPGELARYEAFGHAPRREEWLRGRAALKSVLRRLGNSEDTSLIAFPHARLSLTHSAGLAAAVGCRGPGLLGLGIDFEPQRPMRAGSERFFLTASERDRLGTAGEADRLRLWTLKEALFKADPGNRSDSRNLWSYEITGPIDARQGAARGPADSKFRFFTLDAREGILSVAVLIDPGAHP